MSTVELSPPTVVSPKVTAYIQHLADKKSSPSLRSAYTQSALERRRRRAARLRHQRIVAEDPSASSAPSGPFDEPSYVSSSSESSETNSPRASQQNHHLYVPPLSHPMDHQSVVSALSEDHPASYPMPVTSEVAAAWVSQTTTTAIPAIPEENTLLNTDYLSSNNFIDALIAESSQRWKSVREEVVGNTTTGKLLRQKSDETAMAHNLFSSLTLNEALNEEQEPNLFLQQQAELENFRKSLLQGNSPYSDILDTTTEQIDHIPVEHVEVPAAEAQAPADDLTVWSGWTQHPTAVRRPQTPFEDFPPVQGRRPDIDEASECAIPTNRRVRDLPLTMTAANGTVRKALYSGSLTESGQVTGVGVLKFPETGDLYCGEIVNGKMHGQGTYTFASSKKRKAGKVLKGQFDHNVYVGWVVHHEADISEI
ncbi:hypothetical protein FisN_8Lh249 [Fistulifera solaris]|uniref:Uncharacterized protein n=1 Tax=Fistulifera solaris TaxID=1519565 RepID=A0A1Z5JNU8_FISSO|nr:hypothetical protein FisN_8Lh249 [Fistulifera solaris]|eukprot:GAX15451.1 hypothetical protein FisN_8Lh249 [Fistulifera solaris]